MDAHVYPDTLRRLPVVHRWRSVRWAAGGRWCSRPGTSRGPRPWWPPAGPSSAPQGSRTRRAAPRSPQSEPALGSQLRSPGCNEPSPEGEKFSVFTVNMWEIFSSITLFSFGLLQMSEPESWCVEWAQRTDMLKLLCGFLERCLPAQMLHTSCVLCW